MTDVAAPPAKERWSFSWKHLYDEVVTSGLCTGCAGCVIACPHDVLGYDDKNGVKRYITEIVARDVRFLGGGGGGAGRGTSDQSFTAPAGEDAAPPPAPDDDIPF